MKVEVTWEGRPDIPDQADTYIHCRECLKEIPPDVISPREYARLSVGILKDGRIQVFCTRHELNVAILSFREARTVQH